MHDSDQVDRERHSPSPIQSLPDELLREIFEHAAALCVGKFELNRELRPALLATCVLWRDNAFATPLLWSFIYFTYKVKSSVLSCNLKSIPAQLKHSRTFHLHVGVSPYDSPLGNKHLLMTLTTLGHHLLPHAHRCTSLAIVERGSSGQPMFVPLPGMINLRRLKLETTCRWDPSEVWQNRSSGPLFMPHSPESLDVDVGVYGANGMTRIILRNATRLAGLRRLKVNIDYFPEQLTPAARRFDFQELEVLALTGCCASFHRKVDIVAPKLLYLSYTPHNSEAESWDTPWYFPKLVEMQARLGPYTPTYYHHFVASHLGSLQTLTAHGTTTSAVIRATDPAVAPRLRVLRVLTLGITESLVDALLKFQKARPDVVIESNTCDPRDAMNDRHKAIIGSWRKAWEEDMIERFFKPWSNGADIVQRSQKPRI